MAVGAYEHDENFETVGHPAPNGGTAWRFTEEPAMGGARPPGKARDWSCDRAA